MVGANIKNLRKEKNMLQNELAVKAGISEPYLSEIETGKKEPSLPLLGKIAVALDVPRSELLVE